jgi:hypothetical protein
LGTKKGIKVNGVALQEPTPLNPDDKWNRSEDSIAKANDLAEINDPAQQQQEATLEEEETIPQEEQVASAAATVEPSKAEEESLKQGTSKHQHPDVIY